LQRAVLRKLVKRCPLSQSTRHQMDVEFDATDSNLGNQVQEFLRLHGVAKTIDGFHTCSDAITEDKKNARKLSKILEENDVMAISEYCQLK